MRRSRDSTRAGVRLAVTDRPDLARLRPHLLRRLVRAHRRRAGSSGTSTTPRCCSGEGVKGDRTLDVWTRRVRVKKVGVTGAAGFIGSHLCERLLAEGVRGRRRRRSLLRLDLERRAVPRPPAASRSSVLDCTHRRELRAAFDGCDAIAHLAAKKIPRFGGTLSTLEVNVQGINAACAVALALDADLVFTSTSDVYGDGTPPYREDGEIVLGPPTSQALGLRGVEALRRAPRPRARRRARASASRSSASSTPTARGTTSAGGAARW